ncbi:hypothetical protein SCAR479_03163 [Seiridium cardinale]|uniref:Uncharacterized protein n=1 Tax=Seiridium cardinale TaxID=138064 RepID=A0ABR2Y231_9PEZI
MSIHNHFLAVLHSTKPVNAVLGQAGPLDVLRETITVLALTGQGYQNPPRRRSASNQLRGFRLLPHADMVPCKLCGSHQSESDSNPEQRHYQILSELPHRQYRAA